MNIKVTDLDAEREYINTELGTWLFKLEEANKQVEYWRQRYEALTGVSNETIF